MATWKKVLVTGADITNTTDFSNNTGDLVSTTGTTGIKVSNGGNTMLGNNTQVSVEVDIANVTNALLSGNANADLNAAGGDFLLISDTSASGAIKKVTLANAVGAVSSSVTSVQFTSDEAAQSTGTDQGAVSVKMEGGTGITTSIKTADGDNVVLFTADTASATTLGVATFDETDFDVDSGDVTIKDLAIKTALINGSAVTTAKINDQAVTDAKIATAGISTAGKVNLTALRFHNFGTHETTAANLNSADRIILNDASDELGDDAGDHNYTSTLGTLDGFIGANSASLSNVHSTLDINGDDSVLSLTGGNLTYIRSMATDVHGHVTSASTGVIPNAAADVSGIVTDGTQTFGGAKTFSGAATFSDNLTVGGDLVVTGTTTTLQTSTLNVEDKDIVGAVPSVAHATNNASGYAAAQAASEGGGFFLASHHGSAVAAFAGLSWSASGNLTGWSLNDTAVPEGGAAEAYDASGDANSDKYSVSVMSFGSGSDTAPTGDQMGIGGFHFNTADKKLYVRVD